MIPDLPRRALRRFARGEDGSMVVFSLFLLIMMLIVAGMGVDFVRYESARSRLQTTLDRAVLAAASLRQHADPEAVVRDYFRAAGLESTLRDVTVVQGMNERTVTAEARVDMATIFLPMTGINELAAQARSQAHQSVSMIEISLVLDISGSMRDNSRMRNLRPAAVRFLHSVLDDAEPNTISINLVPYAGQTNPGRAMFDHLAGRRYAATATDGSALTNVSSCLEIPSTAFATTGLPAAGLSQVPHFMFWTIVPTVMDWGWCPQDTTSIIYASQDIARLSDRINTMRMHDGTGTHYAMKWGVALLDPGSQAAFRHLVGRGEVPAVFDGLPRAWNHPETKKYIVLMTDGQITEQWRPVDPLSSANPITELERRPSAQRTRITTAAANVTSFYSMCNLAKRNGVTVFTIAFEAPASAQTEMATCATSASHYYNVSGLDIDTAFRSIATQIQALRLTQ